MTKESILDFCERIAGILFPPRCALCDDVVEFEELCCHSCQRDHLPAEPLITRADELFRGAPACMSLFAYQGVYKAAVVEFKISAQRRQARFFAEQMALELALHWPEKTFDFVTAVPQNAVRRRKAGHNQAEILATALARSLEIPYQYGLLIRLEDSLPQHTLKEEARMKNASRSYQLAKGAGLDGERVLLVDDVLTTGATMAACAACLSAAGAASVHGITVSSPRLTMEKI